MGLSRLNRRKSQARCYHAWCKSYHGTSHYSTWANSLTLRILTSCDVRDLLQAFLPSSSHLIIFAEWEPVGFYQALNIVPKARRILFINYDDSDDHLPPLPPPCSTYCHLTYSRGSVPTPDSKPNSVCRLGTFQESQFCFS